MMMNKERKDTFSLWRYLLLVPLASVLLLVNCTQSKDGNTAVDARPAQAESPAKEVEQQKEGAQQKVYEVVEQMPSFPGGDKALMTFLKENVNYPADAKNAGTQGRVVTRFTVKADGQITDIKVLRSLSKTCDEEAIRVIKKMPVWEPGKQGGEVVPVYFALPIRFALE